ncbi:apolipoprotein D [Diabrotica virgifera virgifera]|uniref:Apolipoprotein D-like n=1 Tax=Diabrotica virgifera virgifera TaxID=50390 RepID=A0A6P7H400_DIAVI|nr:apolipoprotein D [Diabrotica virgifera virgifera]
MIIFAVIFCSVVIYAQAQVPVTKCPTVKVVKGFDQEQLLGDWYEQARYPSTLEDHARCVYTNYYKSSSTTAAPEPTDAPADNSILSTTEFINSDTNEWTILEGNATADPSEPAKFNVTFTDLKLTVPYWILGTDYSGFFVGYSCSVIKNVTGVSLFVLTRSFEPVQSAIDDAIAVIKANKLSTAELRQTDQDVCDY